MFNVSLSECDAPKVSSTKPSSSIQIMTSLALRAFLGLTIQGGLTMMRGTGGVRAGRRYNGVTCANDRVGESSIEEVR
jgi:hypothetical protein